jgi:hypothetical protein
MTTLAYPAPPVPPAIQRVQVAADAVVSAYVRELMRPLRGREAGRARRPAGEASPRRGPDRPSRRRSVR